MMDKRFAPSTYNIEKVKDALAYQKFCRIFYGTEFESASSENIRAFIKLIMHNVEFFKLAAMEVPELRDKATEYIVPHGENPTAVKHLNMKILYELTRPLRPQQEHITEPVSQEMQYLRGSFIQQFQYLVLGFQGEAKDPTRKAMASLTAQMIAELSGDGDTLSRDPQFVEFVHRYAGSAAPTHLATPQHPRDVPGTDAEGGSFP